MADSFPDSDPIRGKPFNERPDATYIQSARESVTTGGGEDVTAFARL
jgi:hypothetical protein